MIKSHTLRHRRAHYRNVIYSFRRPAAWLAFAILALCAFLLAQQLNRRANGAEPATAKAKAEPAAAKKAQAKPAADPYAWKPLFDGKTLKGWKVPQFGGDGEVKVENGAITMYMGASMTGITWTGDVLRTDYELTFEGQRVEGNDFFCTTTFPVGKSQVSLVVGGWGGTVVGISCVDFYDASDNATTTFGDFQNKKWYSIRIRVTNAKIEAWIDDEQKVDQLVADHKLTIRDECDLCQPLGISTWCTTGAVRDIRVRKLRPDEVQEITEAAKKATEK